MGPPGTQWRKPGVTGTDGMFAGCLCPSEEMRVYGKCKMRVWLLTRFF